MLEYSRLCKHRGVRKEATGGRRGEGGEQIVEKRKRGKPAVQGNKSTRLLARPEFLVARLQIFAPVVRMPDSVHGMYVRIYTDNRGSVQRHIGNLARLLRPILRVHAVEPTTPHHPVVNIVACSRMQPLVSLRILTTPYSLFEIADLTSGKAAAKNKLETRLSYLLLYECHNIAVTSFHRHYIFS